MSLFYFYFFPIILVLIYIAFQLFTTNFSADERYMLKLVAMCSLIPILNWIIVLMIILVMFIINE